MAATDPSNQTWRGLLGQQSQALLLLLPLLQFASPGAAGLWHQWQLQLHQVSKAHACC
jgi:hypothetical protein